MGRLTPYLLNFHREGDAWRQRPQRAVLIGWVGNKPRMRQGRRVGRKPRIPNELKRRPFTLTEALAAGISRKSLSGKSWRRLDSEIYCWSGWATNPWELLLAWERRLPADAVFAGLTAAWLHGLDVDPCHPIEVIVPTGSGVRSRCNLIAHRSRLSEATTARGLRVTNLQRTFSDLKARLSAIDFLILADQALFKRIGRFDERAQPAESPMETRLRWLISRSGLPSPEVQRELRDADGRFVGRADLYYAQARLAIEYDGMNHRDRLAEDNRRQNSMIKAGFTLLRFTASDLDRPLLVASQIRALLQRAA